MASRTRWVVRRGDGTKLDEVLRKAGVVDDAVAEGRVFVGRRRALAADEAVEPGDELHIAPKGDVVGLAGVLFADDGLVAVDKPAEVTTIPGHDSASESLLAMVARSLRVHPMTLHPTSRLDRGVSGVVVFARTAEAAERLRVARTEGAYARRYVAIASKAPSPERGEWAFAIGRGNDPRLRTVDGRDAVPALSRYATVARGGAFALLALDPVTGRTHQLRVHAAHAGAPLVGDRAYGGPTRATLGNGCVLSLARVALHAARVRVPRADGTIVEVCAPVPEAMKAWWRAAGGEEAAWDRAMEEEKPGEGEA
jgi:RluA family pseudouridine synthase